MPWNQLNDFIKVVETWGSNDYSVRDKVIKANNDSHWKTIRKWTELCWNLASEGSLKTQATGHIPEWQRSETKLYQSEPVQTQSFQIQYTQNNCLQ